jgi:ribonuclease G
MRTELFLSRVGGRSFAVLREDDVTVELRVEDRRAGTPVGYVIKGRVERVLPGIQCAFVDTGLARNGFLHVSDLILPGETAEPDDAALTGSGGAGEDAPSEAPSRERIERLVRVGDELLVQVSRDETESKGARLTSYVTLPGRYVVYSPQMARNAVSRRIVDSGERERLLAILERVEVPQGGFIVRTAGHGVDEEAFRADAGLLVEEWERIRERAESSRAPAVLHEEETLAMRLLRDLPRDGVEAIVVDDRGLLGEVRAYLGRVDPVLAARVRGHEGTTSLLEDRGLDQEIERALRPKVWLPSGGYLVIEPTEALVSIDVNTGRFVGARDPEDTILRTNLEAAAEIARQLRLRDLGGIIVIDFIDMQRARDRRKVTEALGETLRRDRARTKIVGLSELGLLQLTRKRSRPGFAAQLTRRCPACAGRGRVKTPEAVSAEALAELERVLPFVEAREVTVRAHPDVARAVRSRLRDEPPLGAPGRSPTLRIEDDASLLPDHFDVLAW